MENKLFTYDLPSNMIVCGDIKHPCQGFTPEDAGMELREGVEFANQFQRTNGIGIWVDCTDAEYYETVPAFRRIIAVRIPAKQRPPSVPCPEFQESLDGLTDEQKKRVDEALAAQQGEGERRCSLTNTELITKVKKWVSDLCKTGGHAWVLRVPVDFSHDPDILINEVCDRLSISATAPQPVQGEAVRWVTASERQPAGYSHAKYKDKEYELIGIYYLGEDGYEFHGKNITLSIGKSSFRFVQWLDESATPATYPAEFVEWMGDKGWNRYNSKWYHPSEDIGYTTPELYTVWRQSQSNKQEPDEPQMG